MNQTLILNRPISISWPLELKINFKIFWILSFILIIFLLSFYIFQVNNLAENIYQIRISQKKINELSKTEEILKIELAKANSLSNIEKLVENFGFEKTEKIRYLQILESELAKK